MTHKFGKLLKEARKKSGLSQAKLAEMAGCTRRSVQRYEAEVRVPDLDIADQLLKALDMTLTIGRKGDLN